MKVFLACALTRELYSFYLEYILFFSCFLSRACSYSRRLLQVHRSQGLSSNYPFPSILFSITGMPSSRWSSFSSLPLHLSQWLHYEELFELVSNLSIETDLFPLRTRVFTSKKWRWKHYQMCYSEEYSHSSTRRMQWIRTEEKFVMNNDLILICPPQMMICIRNGLASKGNSMRSEDTREIYSTHVKLMRRLRVR